MLPTCFLHSPPRFRTIGLCSVCCSCGCCCFRERHLFNRERQDVSEIERDEGEEEAAADVVTHHEPHVAPHRYRLHHGLVGRTRTLLLQENTATTESFKTDEKEMQGEWDKALVNKAGRV